MSVDSRQEIRSTIQALQSISYSSPSNCALCLTGKQPSQQVKGICFSISPLTSFLQLPQLLHILLCEQKFPQQPLQTAISRLMCCQRNYPGNQIFLHTMELFFYHIMKSGQRSSLCICITTNISASNKFIHTNQKSK